MESDHKITGKALIFSGTALAGIELIASAFTIDHDAGKWLFLGAIRSIETITLILVLRFLGIGLPVIGLGTRDLSGGFKKGLVWSAGFGVAVCIGFGILFLFRIDPLPMFHMPVPSGRAAMGLFLLVGGVIAPVCEEIFFRGILYGFFRRWGIAAAVIATTLIFAAAHGIGGRFPVTQVVGGVLFALAYEFGGSLMVPITVHVLGNLAIFAAALWL